ncbi:MAG TPA: DUF3455 domain-containing protein [Limnobacter sp.]|nr:DUF3455 domain-containing protein [Limnobacter sp.]
MTSRICSVAAWFAIGLSVATGPGSALAETRQSQGNSQSNPHRNATPATIQVAAGNIEVLSVQARGQVVYVCRREQAPLTTYKWLVGSASAVLTDAEGREIGRHSANPARWSHVDGSFVSGSQVAVSPHGEKNLPFQLVKTDVAGGQGVLTAVSYIQRLGTSGGVAPRSSCEAGNEGERAEVEFTAEYRFWKAS